MAHDPHPVDPADGASAKARSRKPTSAKTAERLMVRCFNGFISATKGYAHYSDGMWVDGFDGAGKPCQQRRRAHDVVFRSSHKACAVDISHKAAEEDRISFARTSGT
jgi:hypothetical protein